MPKRLFNLFVHRVGTVIGDIKQDTLIIFRTLIPGLNGQGAGRLGVFGGRRCINNGGNLGGNGHSDSDGNIALKFGTKITAGFAVRRVVLGLVAALVLLACRSMAYQLRFDFNVPENVQTQMYRHWHWVIGLQMICLYLGGHVSGIYRYFSLPDLQRLACSMTGSGALLYGIRFVDVGYSPPRGVILLQVIFGFLALGALRTGWRLLCERVFRNHDKACARECRVAIIGAGDAGSSLIGDLQAHRHLGLVPVAFFDDNPRKWRSRLHGVRVLGSVADLPHARKKVAFEKVIIAMPSVPPQRLGEVAAMLRKANIPHVTVPGLDQLTSGQVRVSQLRPVRIEDLLGREPIDLRMDEISGVLKGQVVMVTGAGGSIGSELCRQVAAFEPARLLLVEQSEVQLFQIEQELIGLGHRAIIQSLIADILDNPRIDAVMRRHRPSVIFHAAAHKHVGMMETQPSEAIKNNALGTAALAELALEHGVERFVMISTDKAVNPTSVMGATKRLAEVYAQALAKENPGKTRFAAVRFGNVLGSSGSVVPIFERQIAQGGPVTVTHKDVIRYFMTIPEAAGLVLQSCALGEGGEIFVLDMGKPVRIADLARQMIQLSGLEPDRDIEIKYVGLKEGEKLYEELHHLHASCAETSHPRIKCLLNNPEPMDRVHAHFGKFKGLLHSATADELKLIMKSILPEYRPALRSQIEPVSPPRQRSEIGCPMSDAGGRARRSARADCPQ